MPSNAFCSNQINVFRVFFGGRQIRIAADLGDSAAASSSWVVASQG